MTNRDLYLEAGQTPAKIPGLDGLRAVSILIVMLSHSGLQNIVPGVFGVTVFFFISGFLITSLMINELEATGSVSISKFYARRALRLYPPLLAYVAIVTIVFLVKGKTVDPIGLAGALFYFSNYLYALAPEHVAQYGAHLWSLSVEEHFYLMFPLLFVLGAGRNILTLAVLIGLALLIRAIYVTTNVHGETYLLVATECRFDTLLTGCLIALIIRMNGAERFLSFVTHPATVAMALIAIVATFVYREPTFRVTARFTIQNLSLISLVCAAIFTPRYAALKELLNSAPMKWIGVFSYSLYLWHYSAFDVARAVVPYGSIPAYIAGWIAALAIAALIYFAIERPVAILRRRFGSHVHEMSAN